MHKQSHALMKEVVGELFRRNKFSSGSKVLDVGSYNVNGNYRDIFEDKDVIYIGMDVREGPNVNIVCNIYQLNIENEYDLIISGQLLEHLEFPLLAVVNMKRALKAGGWIILIAPFQWSEHKYPIDCWRLLPDGMKFLLEGFESVSSFIKEKDTIGIGRKPNSYKERWVINETKS